MIPKPSSGSARGVPIQQTTVALPNRCLSNQAPTELIEAAGMTAEKAPRESFRLLALELYRENKVLLGRAADLCAMPIVAFMVLAGRHEATMHYSAADLKEGRLTLERLSS